MKSPRLLAVTALALVALGSGCTNDNNPTGLRPITTGPSDVISDGAHGGNHDFFFLPPLVPLPLNNPDFEIGKFNNAIGASLSVTICELKPVYDALGKVILPKAETKCAAAPLKTFGPGTVHLVNLPLVQNGWWTFFHLPPDGFYYVLWNTRDSNLSVDKYYRIKVFVDGAPDAPLGFADVDPMSSLRQWKYSLTNQVIQMIDDILLPIPFRVEKGAFCDAGTLCKSTTVSNTGGIVQLTGSAGSVAGAEFPPNWLPEGAPSSVVVTISSVNTGAQKADLTESIPCHQNLRLEQFDGCFRFTTTPPLVTRDDGKQFRPGVSVRVATCFVLHDTNDPRKDWVQLWASEGSNEPAHALASYPDASILTNHNCVTPDPVITSTNPVERMLVGGLNKVKSGLGRVFGVQTAYAVDVGLGGLLDGFSNVSPVLTAKIIANGPTEFTATAGSAITAEARLVGTQVHNGQPLGDVTLTGNTRGIPGLPVTFTLASGNGTLTPFGSVGVTGVAQMDVTSSPILDSSLSGGFARVTWNVPDNATPGTTFTLNATGPAYGGPVTFTVTIVGQPPTVSANGPYTVPEGGTVTVLGAGTSEETQTLTYAWDLDNDEAGTFETAGQNVSFSAVGIDGPSTRTIRVRATAPSGLSTIASTVVNVLNVAPTGNMNYGPALEGSPVTFTWAAQTDPSASDLASLHYAYVCDGDGTSLATATYNGSGTASTHSCTYDDGPSSHLVVARIIDKDGGFTQLQTLVNVLNVAPFGTLVNNGPVANGSPVTISFINVVDPSVADRELLHFVFDCNGGSLSEATYSNSVSTDVTQTCTFTDAATSHTVRARVIDKDEGFTELQTVVGTPIVPPICTINCGPPCTVACGVIPPLATGLSNDADRSASWSGVEVSTQERRR